jgi:hypothetical protein
MDVEYKRYLAARELYVLFPKRSWYLFIERFLFDLALIDDPNRIDPVYVNMINHPFMNRLELLKSSGYTDEEVNTARSHIINKIDSFLMWLDSGREAYGLEIKIVKTSTLMIYMYGEFTHSISVDIYNMLKRIYTGKNFDYDICKCMLRYKSIIGTTSQTSLAYEYFEYLYSKGYRYELASPFNFMFGMIEYNKNIKPTAAYYTLFPDTDCCFGGTITVRKGFVPKSWSVFNQNYTYSTNEIFNEVIKSEVKHIVFLDSYCLNHISSYSIYTLNLPVFVNDFQIGVPIRYTYYTELTVYATDNDLHNMPIVTLPDLSDHVKKEWNRLTYIDKIINLNNSYEYLNIVERFMISMANLAQETQSTDPVFAPVHQGHSIYITLRSELKEKRIPDYSIQIYKTIQEYLQSDHIAHKVSYSLTPEGLIISSGTKEIKKPINLFRVIALLDRAIRNGSKTPFENLIITVLRYEALVQRGQQWNIPYKWYKVLYEKYNVRLEGFASPLNSQLIMLDYSYNRNESKFCSLFYDTDRIFGSIGSVFKLKLDKPTCMTLNPPYVPKLMEQMVIKIQELLNNNQVLIFTGLPNWFDAPYYADLCKTKHLINKKILLQGDIYYENSHDKEVPQIKTMKNYYTAFVF